LNVARNPANNVSALYALASATPPFQPTLAAAPNDWVVSITYTAGGFGGSIANVYTNQKIAIDALGNVWIPNWVSAGQDNVVELSSNGTVLSGSGGYKGGGLLSPTGIAIDPEGNAWVSDAGTMQVIGSGNVVKFSNSGTVLSGTNGFTGGGLYKPFAIALDGQGNAWVGNGDDTVTEFSNNGTLLSGNTGYPITAIPQFYSLGVAIDASGNAWLNTPQNVPIFELSPSGVPLSPSGGYSNCYPPGPQTRNLQYYVGCWYPNPNPFALDGAGNVWGVVEFEWNPVSQPPTAEFSTGVAEMTNTGTIVSGTFGYAGSTPLGSIGQFLNVLVEGIAIDGGGNVWVMLSNNTVAEFVGAATPVVTPFSLGVKNGTLGQRP
jgi:hypothetical protein